MIPSFVPLAAPPVVEPVAPGWTARRRRAARHRPDRRTDHLAKVHPFLALILGGLTVGIVAGQNINDVIESFATGFGDTAAGVGH